MLQVIMGNNEFQSNNGSFITVIIGDNDGNNI